MCMLNAVKVGNYYTGDIGNGLGYKSLWRFDEFVIKPIIRICRHIMCIFSIGNIIKCISELIIYRL